MNIKTLKFYIALMSVVFLAGNLNAAGVAVNLKNISDDTDAFTLNFSTGYPGDNLKLADQYIQLVFVSTAPDWQVDIYTDNKNTRGYQKGGLVEKTNPNYRIPLGWSVYGFVQPSIEMGDPSQASHWAYVKDKNDVDDPDMGGDQSWDAAQVAGYTSVVYGGIDYANINGNTGVSSPVYLYIEGLYEFAAAGDYEGTIWLDMYADTDFIPPVINHTGIDEIGMVGNRLVIEADIEDNKNIESVDLHYKINGGRWKEAEMDLTESLSRNRKNSRKKRVKAADTEDEEDKKKASFTIEPRQMRDAGTVRYWIEASDGVNIKKWKSRKDPQVVEISRKTEFVEFDGGRLRIIDGNPDDGSVSVFVPKGALENKEDIAIIQKENDDNSVPPAGGLTDSDIPLSVYNFKPHGLRFNKPVTVTLLYFDFIQRGRIKAACRSGEKKIFAERELGLFYWDGFDWRLISTDVDEDKNTVTGKITQFSMLAVFPVKPLEADDYRPKEKIITPATRDSKNDFADFVALNNEYEIEIYDVTGRLVKTITENNEGISDWDGTDEYGNIVESGVYIYQFEAEVDGKKELISGTIVVAK
ncbi:gliding motility-associated C-terminal domain-containing protein [Elusimicrobiota bacterium]